MKEGPRHMTAYQFPDLPPPEHAVIDDDRLVRALTGRDEDAFALLIERYQRQLTRLALRYVPTLAIAEEVVQETWLGVLQGIHRFRGNSSLHTWIVRILINRAITHGTREQRHMHWSASSFADVEAERHGSTLRTAAEPLSPHERVLANDINEQVGRAVATLPPRERVVITLRDIEGWTSTDVCAKLGISNGHQRVLLHRARLRVRQQLLPVLHDTFL
jgi:RNA polymerase sigma-70 factor, ECF subfamily